jgi:hypothetical protein
MTAGVGRVFGIAGRQARVFALMPVAFGTVSFANTRSAPF